VSQTTLKRSLNLPLFTLYGLGNILGAGIYVLIGKVAASSGLFLPIAFFVASIVAAITACTYAEMSSRFPHSAGEAVYLQQGFNLQWLSVLVGLLIATGGIVSAATMARGFAAYFNVFLSWPAVLVMALLIVILALVSIWDITKAVAIAALFTILEILGLCIIIGVGADKLLTLPQRLPELIPAADFIVWQGIFLGAFLAFYAYIGFEDMVNVAEEVKSPRKTVPRGIILTIIIATFFYMLVALIAVLAVPIGQLAGSDAPLAIIYQQSTGNKPVIISLIGMFAITNGILIQIIMASRILYGMSKEGWLPSILGRVHPWTRTPIISSTLVAGIILLLAASLPLESLAKATSYIVLIVFTLVNMALILIKRRDPRPKGVTLFPLWLPVSGLLLCLSLIAVEIYANISSWAFTPTPFH
jgi:basic amino acid/polyamine antiporter, APA family